MVTLTNLAKKEDFKTAVSPIDKPEWTINDVSAEPTRSGNYEYSLVGTAFDYLLRFQIEKENPNKDIYKPEELIAEKAITALNSPRTKQRSLNPEERDVFNSALSDYEEYITGNRKSPPIEASLTFAKLDPIYRGAPISVDDIHLCSTKPYLTEDLGNLLELSEPLWNVEDYAVLNPTLGYLNINADADLILDGQLIDIKTTVKPKFKKEYWHQLVGYLTLLDICSEETRHGWDIESPDTAGIYFARSGDYQKFNSDRVYSDPAYSEVENIVYKYST